MGVPRAVARLLAGCLLVVAAPVQAQPADGAGLGIRLLEAPAARADDPRAQRYIVDHVRAGTTFERELEIINDRPFAGTVDLYANAAVVREGTFLPSRRGEQNELTSWITVNPTEVVLASRARAEVVATVRVPNDARPGEYYGVVFAELPGPPVPSGASINSRTGIRVYLSVGRGAEPASDFVVDSLQASRAKDGAALVTARVHNTGDRALDLGGSLNLTDGPGGLSGGPFPAQLGTTLAPGQTAPVTVPLDKAISGGPWTATLTLRSGLLERIARAEITFPDAAGAEAAPVKAENLSLAEDPKILVPIAVSLILLIALLLLWWLLARRRTPRKDDKEPEPVPAG